MRKLFLALALLLTTTAARAWNAPGHMAVACVAWRHLDPAHKVRITALLKLNPYYSRWSAYADTLHLTGDVRDMAIFMYAATWPDEIVPDKAYHGGFAAPPNGPATEPILGYTDMERHLYWHFINKPYSPDQSSTAPAPQPNAATEIPAFRTALAAHPADDLASYEVVWLEHMVGDLHQPLHSIERILNGEGDRGATRLKLNGPPTTLHAFWDDLPGDQDPTHPESDFRTAVRFADTLHPAPRNLFKITDVDTWVQEGYLMGQRDVYRAPIELGLGPYTLTPEYKAQALQDAKLRVELAGERLALLLRTNLK